MRVRARGRLTVGGRGWGWGLRSGLGSGLGVWVRVRFRVGVGVGGGQTVTTVATVERGKSMREGIERKTAHASCTMAMAMRNCLRQAKTRTVVTRVSTW